MEDVLRLPQVPSWTRWLWVGAELSASWNTISCCPGSSRLQFTKGSDASEGSESSPWGGTEDGAPLSPPGGSNLGKWGRLFLAAWPGNCLWVAPGLALPRCKLLAVNPVNSRVSVCCKWLCLLSSVPAPPSEGDGRVSPDGKVVCLWKQMNIENLERERWEPRGYFKDMASFSCPLILFTARFRGHLSLSSFFFYCNCNSVLMVKLMIITVNAGSVFFPRVLGLPWESHVKFIVASLSVQCKKCWWSRKFPACSLPGAMC